MSATLEQYHRRLTRFVHLCLGKRFPLRTVHVGELTLTDFSSHTTPLSVRTTCGPSWGRAAVDMTGYRLS
jgi:hypothetical protein